MRLLRGTTIPAIVFAIIYVSIIVATFLGLRTLKYRKESRFCFNTFIIPALAQLALLLIPAFYDISDLFVLIFLSVSFLLQVKAWIRTSILSKLPYGPRVLLFGVISIPLIILYLFLNLSFCSVLGLYPVGD